MDQSTTPKRKPGRPRKQKPESNPSEANPLEATIKAARKAYDPQAGIQFPKSSKASESPREGQGQANPQPITQLGAVDTAPTGECTSHALGLSTGAAICTPLPPLRVRGELSRPEDWVKSLSEAQVEAFATAWIATGKRTKWLFQNSDQFGRENASTRGAILRELEAHPVCKLTVSRLTGELVMSDLERRKRLKDIAAAAPHELRGYADQLKAIEIDSRHDPESVENKRRSEAANSLTFNAPVSLFFMPSTQARAIPSAPEPKQAEAIEVQTRVASSSLPTSLPSHLPPVGGGTPRT